MWSQQQHNIQSLLPSGNGVPTSHNWNLSLPWWLVQISQVAWRDVQCSNEESGFQNNLRNNQTAKGEMWQMHFANAYNSHG